MNRFERIEYEPISVREALVQMKDLSELMIDLAYSSALFDSKGLAQEVMEIGERVDRLAYLLDMNAMVATRGPRDAESLAGVMRVASAAETVSNAALSLAGMVLRGNAVRSFVEEAFADIEQKLARIEVKHGSTLIGNTISELGLTSRIGANVIALRRNRDWTIKPRDQALLPGDVLIARGTATGLEKLRDFAEAEVDIGSMK